jgi:hypothetical protein
MALGAGGGGTMNRLFGLVCLLSLGCAGGPAPSEHGRLGWDEIDDRWSLHVVTVDSDGDERVTRIWIAVVDGDPAIRTGESRWWRNLQREPVVRIRLSGVDYSFRVRFVTASEEKVRIDEAFAEKYGGWERFMFPQTRGETHENYALLRSSPPTS